jgi:hypothetical protein
MKCRFWLSMLAACMLSFAFASSSHAVQTTYSSSLSTLNASGVTGTATLLLDTDAMTLNVVVEAMGLEPNVDHLMHIHGLLGGDGTSGNPAVDSNTPTIADDADMDGFIEVLEGLPQYGDILLPLQTQNTATASFAYSETFDLPNDSLFFSPVSSMDYTSADIMPLEFREIVIHGLTVDGSAGAGTDGEIDGTAGFKATLPVAAGTINQVIPEPGTISVALLSLVVAGALSRRKRLSPR